jgi:hypothetical protein
MVVIDSRVYQISAQMRKLFVLHRQVAGTKILIVFRRFIRHTSLSNLRSKIIHLSLV